MSVHASGSSIAAPPSILSIATGTPSVLTARAGARDNRSSIRSFSIGLYTG